MLDGLHLNLVRWVFPLAVSQGLLQSLSRVESDGMSPGPEELVQVLHQVLTAGEEPSGEPHQLPAPLLRQSVTVVSQLLHHLAVNLVPEYFLRMRFIVGAGRVIITTNSRVSAVPQIFDLSAHFQSGFV